MSHATMQRRKCLRKYRYPSMAEADRWARIDFGKTGGKLDSYECPHCDGWHLTSSRSIDRSAPRRQVIRAIATKAKL